MKLAEMREQWPTPMAHDTHLGDPERVGRFGTAHGGRNLTDEASAWQTPGTDSFRSRGGDRKDEMGLDQQARHWPTPGAMVSNDGEQPETWRARQAQLKQRGYNGNGAGVPLAIAAQEMSQQQRRAAKLGGGGIVPGAWPTPATRDFKGANSEQHVTTTGTGRMHMDQLPNFVEHSFSPPDPEIQSGPRSLQPIPFSPLPSPSSTSGPLLDAISDFRRWSERSGGAAGWQGTWIRSPRRALNPRFVELLMGWAVGWTGSEPVGMAFSHWRQLSLIYLSGLSSPKIEQQGSLF
jgi:hypothetical protein